MSNEAKASAMLANVRALKPAADPPKNKLGLRFFEEQTQVDTPYRPIGGEGGMPLTLEQVKAIHIQRVIDEYGRNMANVARILAIDRRTLYAMIERHGLTRRPRK